MNSTERATYEVLEHHLTAFGNNDLYEIMKDYTEGSEVLSIEGPIKGLTAIRKFFADYFIAIPTGSAFEMKQLIVSGSAAFIAWSSDSEMASIPLGTDTFLFEGDKIRLHTVAAYINSK